MLWQQQQPVSIVALSASNICVYREFTCKENEALCNMLVRHILNESSRFVSLLLETFNMIVLTLLAKKGNKNTSLNVQQQRF